MYAGPVRSEVPNYEIVDGVSSQSLIFNVAFGLSDRADQVEMIEDDRYGSLSAKQTYRSENGTLSYRTLKTEPCTEEQFNEDFFPINSRF